MKKIVDFVLISIWEPFNLFFLICLRFSKFHHISFALSLIPFRFGMLARKRFYKKSLKKVGVNLEVYYGAILSYADITLGDNVRIGPYNTLGKCSLGNNVLLAQNIHILSGRHQHSIVDVQALINTQEGERKEVKVGDNTWIGASSVVMDDIGENCVVGAGSVVVHQIEDNSIAVGNPAKTIKKR